MRAHVILALHGTGAHLLKVGSKRKRSRAEFVAMHEDAARQEAEQAGAAKRLKDLEAQLALARQEAENGPNAAKQLEGLLKSGQARLDKHGIVQLVAREQSDSFKKLDPSSSRK